MTMNLAASIVQTQRGFLRARWGRESTRLLALATFFSLSLGVSGQELAERRTAPGGGFSLRPPAGWKVEMVAQGNAIKAQGSDGMNFQAQEAPNETGESLSDFANAMVQALAEGVANFKKLDSSAFQTRSGLKGVEVFFEMTNKSGNPVRQVIYFFDGRPGAKIFATFGVAASLDNKAAHRLYAEVASSIRVEK